MNEPSPLTLFKSLEHALRSLLNTFLHNRPAGMRSLIFKSIWTVNQVYQQHSFDDDIDIKIPLSWRTEINNIQQAR